MGRNAEFSSHAALARPAAPLEPSASRTVAAPLDESRAQSLGHTVASIGAAPIQRTRGTFLERFVDRRPQAVREAVGAVRDDKIGPETNKIGLPDAINSLTGALGDEDTHASIGAVTSELSNIGTGVASGLNAPFALADFSTAVRKRVTDAGHLDDNRALENRALNSAERFGRDALGVAAAVVPEALGTALPVVGAVTVGMRGKDASQKALASAYLAKRSRKLKRRAVPADVFEVHKFKQDRKETKADIRSGRTSSADGLDMLAGQRESLSPQARDLLLLREFRKEARKAVRNQAVDTAILAAGQGAAPVSGGLSAVGGALGAAGRQTASQRHKIAAQLSLLTDAPAPGSGARSRLQHAGRLARANVTTKARAKQLGERAPEAARVDLPLNRRDELAKQAATAIIAGTDSGRSIRKAARMAGVSSKNLRFRDREDYTEEQRAAARAAAHARISKALRDGLLSSSSRGVLEQTVGVARATRSLGREALRRHRGPAGAEAPEGQIEIALDDE